MARLLWELVRGAADRHLGPVGRLAWICYRQLLLLVCEYRDDSADTSRLALTVWPRLKRHLIGAALYELRFPILYAQNPTRDHRSMLLSRDKKSEKNPKKSEKIKRAPRCGWRPPRHQDARPMRGAVGPGALEMFVVENW